LTATSQASAMLTGGLTKDVTGSGSVSQNSYQVQNPGAMKASELTNS
jgi:hypothetical protein